MSDKPEEVKAVQREPHPFISKAQMPCFYAKTIAFVGRFDRAEDATSLVMKTADGTDVKVIKFKGDVNTLKSGCPYEIRGIVNKDGSISFGECTPYDDTFDLASYENMLKFYHGMCRSHVLRS